MLKKDDRGRIAAVVWYLANIPGLIVLLVRTNPGYPVGYRALRFIVGFGQGKNALDRRFVDFSDQRYVNILSHESKERVAVCKA